MEYAALEDGHWWWCLVYIPLNQPPPPLNKIILVRHNWHWSKNLVTLQNFQHLIFRLFCGSNKVLSTFGEYKWLYTKLSAVILRVKIYCWHSKDKDTWHSRRQWQQDRQSVSIGERYYEMQPSRAAHVWPWTCMIAPCRSMASLCTLSIHPSQKSEIKKMPYVRKGRELIRENGTSHVI